MDTNKPTSCARHSRLRTHLPILLNLTVIVALVVLDVRDLIYKAIWIGPTDSYSFRCGSSSDFIADHLVPTVRPPDTNATSFGISSKNLSAVQPDLVNVPVGVATSGWPSFLSRCERVHPFSSFGFFLSAMGVNCHIDETGTVWDNVVFTSNHRVDAMVWTSCQLLPVVLRPQVCYEEMTANFLSRYHIAYPTDTIALAPTLTIAQQNQLLRLLELVSESMQYAHRIICVEIVQFGLDEYLTPFAFGCASANVFRSEFVVMEDFWKIQYQRGWLTMDVLQIAGFQFGIRQNCVSQYIVTNTSTTPSTFHLQSKTQINFSSFGHFYAFLLVIDATLLVLNLWSSVEILERFIAPEQKNLASELRNRGSISPANAVSDAPAGSAGGGGGSRNGPAGARGAPTTMDLMPIKRAASTVLRPVDQYTQVLAKDRNMYYSYFSSSLYRNTFVAILTTITQCLSWFIILPNSVVWTWSELTSQKFRAYQTSIRVWVLLLILMHTLWDFVAKVNERLAYRFVRNTYLTSVDIVFTIIMVSIGLRKQIFDICEIKWSFEIQRINDLNTFPGYLAHGNAFSVGNDHQTNTPLFTLWTIFKPLVHVLCGGVGVAFAIAVLKYVKTWLLASCGAASRTAERDLASRNGGGLINGPPLGEYRRLPMEIMLDSPIRARSLIRNDLEMETFQNGRWEIRPSCYVDFGVSVADGFYRSRAYFSNYIKPVLHQDNLKKLVDLTESVRSPQASSHRNANSTLSPPTSMHRNVHARTASQPLTNLHLGSEQEKR